ncbi:MAG TPA: helicase HerA-like domain-containing protein, partial [Polyangiaceae bacterium]|nr:helicase HerA-like domain-containing protein [Polyangiaceae bacterium]
MSDIVAARRPAWQMAAMPSTDLCLGRAREVSRPDAESSTFLLPPHHLVTHGVVLGMTGSGKTGLTLGLVEEALAAKVPVLMVDIKGDLGNVFFSLGDAEPSAFLPWIDGDAAARAGKTPAALAEETAARYRAGLEAAGSSAAIARQRRLAMRPRIITPGASFGEQLDVLSSLSRPTSLWQEDTSAARDQLASAVSLVLRLAGRDGDVRSREHVVLSTLAERRLVGGASATLPELLRDVMAPPIPVVGAMSFDEFFPPKEQQALAQDLNTLIASPKLSSWLSGTALDVAGWLKLPADGGTPAVLVTVAHLDDEERALVLGLLLDEVLGWVRGLSGTSDLRALVVFDEVFGFLPPAPYDPPTKKPILALLKQARAFGVGVVVATQNPMDVDYKALSNAGAWFVGRLQTDADRERVVDGLVGADGGMGGLTPAEIGTILKNLPPRTFFVRDVHRKPACALLETRTVSSWLRGPMTRREIARLYAELRPANASASAPAAQNGAAKVDVAGSPGAAPAKTVAAAPLDVAGGASGLPPLPAMWRSFFGRVPD